MATAQIKAVEDEKTLAKKAGETIYCEFGASGEEYRKSDGSTQNFRKPQEIRLKRPGFGPAPNCLFVLDLIHLLFQFRSSLLLCGALSIVRLATHCIVCNLQFVTVARQST